MNMLTEVKILFNNIKNLRHLLTEGVGEKDIKDAIQNHEWLYLYYEGDENSKTGYRTVRPYVLGTHKKSGKLVLRAWQDNAKNSETFDNRPTRKDSKNHDYWTDEEGMKPGWRMFRLDRISKVYPIGKKFHDSNGLVMIPAGYHEGGDDDMGSIIAYVSTKTQPDFDYKYDKEFHGDEKSKTDINKEKWDSIRRGNKNKRRITAADVVKLRDIASNVYKKNRGSFLVAIDDKNNYQLILVSDKDKKNIPDTAIMGSLPYLYDTLVKQNVPADNRFFNDTKNKLQTNIKNKQSQVATNQPQGEIRETELPSIPFEKKTFFKQ